MDQASGERFRRRRALFTRFAHIPSAVHTPVQGVQVKRYLFWSDYNHCGGFSGAEKLGMVVTDADGYVPVPDGDIRYAFDLYKPHYDLKHPTKDYRSGELITRLSARDTVVQLHRAKKRALRMHVTVNGRPVEGKKLMGRASGCPGGVCAACEGEEGTTDANGMIYLPEFYPEEREAVYFLDDSEQDRIWEADPRTWPRKGTIEVDLGLVPTPTVPESTPTPDDEPRPACP